ncbi:MAG: nucleotide exchange factor GrpE [Ilumatobacteraceae bacterium]
MSSFAAPDDDDVTPPTGVPVVDDDTPSVAAADGSDPPEHADAAESVEDESPEVLASEIAAEIVQLSEQRDQYRDLAQRVQADFENYRKRVQTQMRDEADRATAKLAEALLPVLDATEAAFLRHPAEIEPLLNVMLAELRKQGLETLHLDGQPFDPNLADAVAHEPAEGGEVVVAEVLRSGYRWNGKTLRPAMVRTRD